MQGQPDGSIGHRKTRRRLANRRTIDGNGDLLIKGADGGPPERTSLVDALARAAWYNPQARAPKFG